MRQNPGTQKTPAEQVVKDIRRCTKKHHSPEEKNRFVLEVDTPRISTTSRSTSHPCTVAIRVTVRIIVRIGSIDQRLPNFDCIQKTLDRIRKPQEAGFAQFGPSPVGGLSFRLLRKAVESPMHPCSLMS